MTEKDIERVLLEKLTDLKYIYRNDIRDLRALEDNFRAKFEALNQVTLTDGEFERLKDLIISPDVYAASQTLRQINSLERDDGTQLNFSLVNINDWCKNTFEVVNQLRINSYSSHHRYDVILLINGVPVAQIELKTLSITPRRAMQQIVDYKNDPGNGYTRTLLCFMQLFIVSNFIETWYFANNNPRHFSFDADERFLPVYQFAHQDNQKISCLNKFAETFLPKCHLAQMINRYMVLVASEQKLLMMRPYQIYAVQAIVECIQQNSGNGYIWHTTGSGKTLTSFKASTLLKDNPAIEKCLFVVDRKDLDRQTREEFNRFQEGCVEENTNTETLVRRLLSDDYADKVIVTTIQKLGLALDGTHKRDYKSRLQPLSKKRMVFIFDECHRSQFGENHRAIKEFFPNAQLFGFTGTPIFEQNASQHQVEDQQASHRTTASLFQQCLHQYTITHAIDDRNVLRFHLDYYKPQGETMPPPGEGFTKEKIIETILTKHQSATAGRKFNAILATASINDAIEYFEKFQSIQADKQKSDPDFNPLRIACVFSPPVQVLGDNTKNAKNAADVRQFQEDLPQEKHDNQQDPEAKKAALQKIITHYNTQYGANHRLSEFDSYYQDVQKRIKDQQYPNSDLPPEQKIDITIVVDMLLTGFDSKYLNTLYVDKNLKYHGLIQAFSRTNRVLNDSKPYGNILEFRQQNNAVEDAIALFSGENIDKAATIWLVDPAPVVIGKLQEAMDNLQEFMQSKGLEAEPHEVVNLKGDKDRSEFVNRFKEVQRLVTQIDQYTDLEPEQKQTVEAIIPKSTLQGFRSSYIETAKQLRDEQSSKGDAASEEVQQLDFEFVLFASAIIDYDYIMALIARMTEKPAAQSKMNRDQLVALIQSDAKFIDDGDDIAEYIHSLPSGQPLNETQIREGYEQFKNDKKNRAVQAIARKFHLPPRQLQAFVDTVLQRAVFDGEELTEMLEPLELGWKERSRLEVQIVAELMPLLRKLAAGNDIAGLKAYEG